MKFQPCIGGHRYTPSLFRGSTWVNMAMWPYVEGVSNIQIVCMLQSRSEDAENLEAFTDARTRFR